MFIYLFMVIFDDNLLRQKNSNQRKIQKQIKQSILQNKEFTIGSSRQPYMSGIYMCDREL